MELFIFVIKNITKNRSVNTRHYMENSKTFVRVTDLADSDRPREKALEKGIGVLTDTELLAIILGSGMPGKSVLSLSREILNDNNNSLARVSRMTTRELTSKYQGIGPAKAISLMAAIELGARCMQALSAADQIPAMTSSEAVYNYMRHKLERLVHEEFWALLLNRSNRIISAEKISQGGVSATVVDVRILLKKALDCMASGIILCHNHPSGALRPSAQDDSLTRKIAEAARLFDITVMDHVIVGQSGYYSYRDEGKL